MKTRHHLAAAFCIAATLIAGIGLASCTEDARTPDTDADADLTTTPLIFTASMAASADAPATRANTARGEWTEGDWVAVEADGVVKKYLVHLDNGTATLRPADIDNTHFRPAADQFVSVRAWRYGDDTEWNLTPAMWSVEDTQNVTPPGGDSSYQQSDFLYAPAKSVSYSPEAGAGLTFYHQTARIVIRIREAGVVTADNKGKIDVYIGSNKGKSELRMDGTFDAARIDPATGQYSGLTAGRGIIAFVIPNPIPEPATGYACSYEALVIPQDMSNKTLIELYLSGKIYQYIPTSTNFLGGYTYTYDITVSEHGKLEVTASEPIPDWVDSNAGGSGMAHEAVIPLDGTTTISDNRTYLLTGTRENVQDLLKITGGTPTIILRDLDIKGKHPITIRGGTPTFKVEGENRIIATTGPAIGLNGETDNVRIIGDIRDNNRLTAVSEDSGSSGYPAIGDVNGACGSISLSDITLIAKGNGNANLSAYAAAIGTSGYATVGRKCGPITITNCHVEATAGGPGAAAIGFGYCDRYDEHSTHEMGDITITNSTLKCTVEPKDNVWPAHIGGSSSGTGQYTVGKISITPPEGTKGEEFFRDFNRNGGNADVIVGFPRAANPSNSVLFDVWWRRSLRSFIDWASVPDLQ